MFHSRLILPVLLACATLPAHARQSTPAVGYDSAFAGYKAYQEPKVADWKQTNATVAALPGHGAHAGHAMGAMAPAAAADPHAGHDMSTMQKASTPATADPHAGHDMSKMQNAAAPVAADPHAGHDMGKMQHPAKPAAKARADKPAPQAAKVRAPKPVKAAKPDPHADHQHH